MSKVSEAMIVELSRIRVGAYELAQSMDRSELEQVAAAALRVALDPDFSPPVEQGEVERLREAIKRLEHVYHRFGSGPVMEICDPHPENPSPNIQPFYSSDLRLILAALRNSTDGETK